MAIKHAKNFSRMLFLLSMLGLFAACKGDDGGGSGSSEDSGDSTKFPATIAISGAASGIFTGEGSLKNDFVCIFNNDTGLMWVHGTVLSLSSKGVFSTSLIVGEASNPVTGTYDSGMGANGNGTVTLSNRKWKWDNDNGAFTVVIESIETRVINPQTSVNIAHGTLDATLVPVCVSASGVEEVCSGGDQEGVGNITVHAEF
jgi:hypothetical protein